MTIQVNDTHTVTTENSVAIDLEGWDRMWVYIFYICQCIVIGGSNLMVAMSILRYEALHVKKHCLIIFGLSFADSMNQFAFLAAGIYRIILIFMGTHNGFRTPVSCMLTPHTIIWSYSETLASLMLVVASIDRLLSVALPLRYIKWDVTKYATQTVGLAYVYALITGLCGTVWIAFNQPQNQTLPAICFMEDVIGTSYPMYLKYYMNVSSVFGVSSVVIYIFVWVTYQHHTSKVAEMTILAEEKLQLHGQHRLTVSLGISSFCTLFLSVIPLFVGHLAANQGYVGVTMASFVMSSLNPLANVIIYWKRQKNIRKAIKSMLQCKELPSDTRLWHAYNMPHSPRVVRPQA